MRWGVINLISFFGRPVGEAIVVEWIGWDHGGSRDGEGERKDTGVCCYLVETAGREGEGRGLVCPT